MNVWINPSALKKLTVSTWLGLLCANVYLDTRRLEKLAEVSAAFNRNRTLAL